MDTSEKFRDFARECDWLAQEVARTEQQRRTLREIAAAWRKVADEHDQDNFNRAR